MITVSPFANLGAFQNDWLDAHYHFSFAGYHDPARMGVGALRVWNDDAVAPHGGFATHGHEDMEVITYVRAGAITHQDDLGNRGVLRAGDVQVMHAGTGIRHSEMNEADETCRLFQIWILPDRAGHPPGWETRQFPTDPVAGLLPTLVSGRAGAAHDGALLIHQDAAIHGGRVAAGESVHHLLGPGRAAYVVPVSGIIELGGVRAEARDGIAITGEEAITITAVEECELALVDVPAA
jgi:redox-sensitive bicupin YhaK (pirin superfamily)